MARRFLTQMATPTITGLPVPIGTLLDYAGGGDPDPNWMLCDGRAISRAGYPELYSAIGTTFGTGDGTTTFNIPDMRGRIAVAADDLGTAQGAASRIPNSNRARGQNGGVERHTLAAGEMPSHAHQFYATTASQWGSIYTNSDLPLNADGNGGSVRATPAMTTGGAGSGTPHNNMQPYQVTTKIIRVL